MRCNGRGGFFPSPLRVFSVRKFRLASVAFPLAKWQPRPKLRALSAQKLPPPSPLLLLRCVMYGRRLPTISLTSGPRFAPSSKILRRRSLMERTNEPVFAPIGPTRHQPPTAAVPRFSPHSYICAYKHARTQHPRFAEGGRMRVGKKDSCL